MPASPSPEGSDADGWEGDELSLEGDDGDGNDGDGNDGDGVDGDDGDGNDGEGTDGDGNDGDGNVGSGDDDGDGWDGGEGIEDGEDGEDGDGVDGVDCGERLLGLLGLLGNGFGIPCGWEDGSGTLQPANTNANTTARAPIADFRIDVFDDERIRYLTAISLKTRSASRREVGSASANSEPDHEALERNRLKHCRRNGSRHRSAHWNRRKESPRSGST